jgi:hypothetical protein
MVDVEERAPSAFWVNSDGFGGLGGGGGNLDCIVGFLGMEEAGKGPRSNGEGVL